VRLAMKVLIVVHLLGLLLVSLTATAEPAAQRIVAVGGAVTEVLYAVGAGERIVARDTTSQYPAPARALPDVGYMRRLSAEPILALAPDMIIAIEDAGPKESIAILEQAGVAYRKIPDVPTVEGTLEKIRAVAAAVDMAAEGDALAKSVAERIAAVRATVPQDKKPRAVFLLSVGRGGLLAGGRDTSADAIITLAGGENVAAAFEGYKPFEPEAFAARDPEVIIVTDRTLEALGGKDAIAAMPAFAGTAAAKSGRIVAFDGLMLLGFSTRLADAIEATAGALHEGAAK